MSTAVITFTYNENINLPIWCKYYGTNFGPENLFVIDRGSDDGSIHDLGAVNVIRVPRKLFDEYEKTNFMSLFHESLFSFYDTVILTDCDEILVADPEKYASLAKYVESADFETMNAIGLDLVHLIEKEAPLDPTQPILSQRRIAKFQSPSCKKLVSRRPLKWLPGFHSCNVAPCFDHVLYMLHLKVMDETIAMARQKINQSTAWSQRSLDQKFGEHHRFTDERFRHENFLVPADQYRKNNIMPFEFKSETEFIVQSTQQAEGYFYIPMNMKHKFVELPERFRTLF